ncbi:tetratricopeptide repeat protein [Caulobacter sp. 602-2]|uniref:Tetratricopeptide repeat protein n=2 Tax=Caulobacter sp. 602-2 TaxID=2710887 RepID=A0A6G4R1Y6_9CAUL|nr:tetratricopeptide repeat protein [Caulobacter sp. 602-2]
MLARIVGIILGLILATSGYVISGLGTLGTWAVGWDLGPFEPHRTTAGWAAMTLGGILLVAALIPRMGTSRRGTRRRKGSARGGERSLTKPFDMGGPEPAAAIPAMTAPVMTTASTVQAAPAPAQAPASAPAPAAPVGATEFEILRAEMLALCGSEAWNPAARVLARLVRAAETDRERTIAYRDLGDFAAAQGRHDDAAEAYEEAVSYARMVRKAAPNDPTADELLAGALAGVGDTAEAEGRLNEALSAFEEALALRRSPGGREAADPGAQRALSVALERLADLREDRGHRMRALDLYRESYDVTARLAAADPARFGLDLVATRARLEEIEARVAG